MCSKQCIILFISAKFINHSNDSENYIHIHELYCEGFITPYELLRKWLFLQVMNLHNIPCDFSSPRQWSSWSAIIGWFYPGHPFRTMSLTFGLSLTSWCRGFWEQRSNSRLDMVNLSYKVGTQRVPQRSRKQVWGSLSRRYSKCNILLTGKIINFKVQISCIH